MRSLAVAASEASRCTRCLLADTRTQVVYGSGTADAELMVIGEAPGKDEDAKGVPFIGRSGQLLIKLLGEELGLGREQVYIANVVKCRPPDNRDPKPDEIAACSSWLEEQLDSVKPLVVMPVGNFSTKLLLQTNEGITKVRGQVYDWVSPGGHRAALVPTFHPAAALQGGGADIIAKMRADLVLVGRALAERRAGQVVGA